VFFSIEVNDFASLLFHRDVSSNTQSYCISLSTQKIGSQCIHILHHHAQCVERTLFHKILLNSRPTKACIKGIFVTCFPSHKLQTRGGVRWGGVLEIFFKFNGMCGFVSQLSTQKTRLMLVLHGHIHNLTYWKLSLKLSNKYMWYFQNVLGINNYISSRVEKIYAPRAPWRRITSFSLEDFTISLTNYLTQITSL